MNLFKRKAAVAEKRNIKTDYFAKAASWADDTFGALEQSRNRYQAAFVLAMGVNVVALIAVCALANIQTLVPMMVHHYDHGVTTVEPLTYTNAPLNKAQIESDLAHYLTHRESYDISSYRAQFDLVNLLSSETVAAEYAREQDRNVKDSPIQQLGATHMRDVHIYSINFLDNVMNNVDVGEKNHQNLAEIVFTSTDTDKASGLKTEHHYNALVSWTYVTPSTNPDVRWKNWDGFMVTRFTRQLRNV